MNKTIPFLMMIAMAAPVSFVACDRTVSETEHTRSDSAGNVQKESKTVREDAGGNVTVTKEKTDRTVDNH